MLSTVLGQSSGCAGLHNPTSFSGWYGKTGIRETGISTSTTIYNTASISSSIISWNSLANISTNGSCGSGCNKGSNPDNNKKRFQIITTTGNDVHTGYNLPRIPFGATRSIRLGDMCSAYNYSGEALFYEMTITPQNALVLIDYAIVMESPAHGPRGNPEFVIRVSKKIGNQWQNAQ